jgi:hypothetical protein
LGEQSRTSGDGEDVRETAERVARHIDHYRPIEE